MMRKIENLPGWAMILASLGMALGIGIAIILALIILWVIAGPWLTVLGLLALAIFGGGWVIDRAFPRENNADERSAKLAKPVHPTFTDRVRDTVPQIPRGHVLTFDCIAALAGNPVATMAARNAVFQGRSDLVGWHRVVTSKGEMISGGPVAEQRKALMEEGVRFANNCVDLKCHLWEEAGCVEGGCSLLAH